jgi:hypothetical protein
MTRKLHGHATKGAHSSEYDTWIAARQRCSNPNDPRYPQYGGRGIRVCDEWSDFSVFYRDMGPRPSSRHSLDRRDNDGNYEPGNCRWATTAEQNRNHRRNIWVEHEGALMILADAVRAAGFTRGAVERRVRERGCSYQEAFDGVKTSPRILVRL